MTIAHACFPDAYNVGTNVISTMLRESILLLLQHSSTGSTNIIMYYVI